MCCVWIYLDKFPSAGLLISWWYFRCSWFWCCKQNKKRNTRSLLYDFVGNIEMECMCIEQDHKMFLVLRNGPYKPLSKCNSTAPMVPLMMLMIMMTLMMDFNFNVIFKHSRSRYISLLSCFCVSVGKRWREKKESRIQCSIHGTTCVFCARDDKTVK